MTWLIIVVVGTALYVYLRTRSGRKTEAPVGDISGPGDYDVDIVGESNYQDALEEICGGRAEGGARKPVKALLILEDGESSRQYGCARGCRRENCGISCAENRAAIPRTIEGSRPSESAGSLRRTHRGWVGSRAGRSWPLWRQTRLANK